MDGEDMAEGVMEMLTAEEPQELYMPTGFPSLDDLLDGLVVGRVNVVAARTGHGKSAFADQLMLNVAKRGKKVLKFDLENSEMAVKTRLSANLSGVPAQAIQRHAQHKSKLDKQQFRAVSEAADTMQDLPHVVDTTSDADSSYIRSRCLAEESDGEVGLVIVDYVTQMAERGDGAMERAMNAMGGLHALAKALNVPVVAISQVNRKPASGDTEPQLHHLSWSDDVAQVPAQVHMLYHPHTHWEQTDRNPGGEPDEEDLFLYTRKNKGPAGATKLKFDTDTLRICDENDPAPF
jgi:replicative DNA helicase